VPDNNEKNAELEAILQAGITTINISGTVTTFDLNVILKRLLELQLKLA